MSDGDKGIFIDEGWKAQVQREKEETAKKLQAAQPVEAAEAHVHDENCDHGHHDGEIDPDIPSFDALVANLTTQAMMALGVIVPQGVTQVQIMLDQAGYVIETLAMLMEKTKGNLSPQEEAHIAEAIGELHKIYLIRDQQLQEQELRQAGIDPMHLKDGIQ
jgi:hypothetical protein